MTDGVPLREYVERVFDEKERTLQARLDSAHRALDAASKTLDGRLEQMNEFRLQITTERALYVQRDMLDARVNPVEQRVRTLEDSGSNLAGRFWALGIAWALLTTILNVAVTFVLRIWFK